LGIEVELQMIEDGPAQIQADRVAALGIPAGVEAAGSLVGRGQLGLVLPDERVLRADDLRPVAHRWSCGRRCGVRCLRRWGRRRGVRSLRPCGWRRYG